MEDEKCSCVSLYVSIAQEYNTTIVQCAGKWWMEMRERGDDGKGLGGLCSGFGLDRQVSNQPIKDLIKCPSSLACASLLLPERC